MKKKKKENKTKIETETQIYISEGMCLGVAFGTSTIGMVIGSNIKKNSDKK